MGKDHYATDAAFGFQPYGDVLRAQIYAVITAPTIYVFVNDLVVHGGVGVATPIGHLPAIEDSAVPDGNPSILGSVLAIFDEDMMPLKYIAPARTGNGTIAGYVLVADHPDQLFIAQEDGETNAIDSAEIGQNIDIISGTLCLGNTNTGISLQELDSNTAATTAALQMKIIRPHEDDTIENDTYHWARWIVQVNEGFYHPVVGLGI